MAFQNPDNADEIFYGASGDVRNEVNANAAVSTAGHYVDENEMPGALVIRSIRRATRLINTYLEPTYANQIPFSAVVDVPLFIDEIASDIATFYCLRSLAANVGPVSEEKKRDYFDVHTAPASEFGSSKGTLPMLRDREIQLPELTSSYADDAKSIRASDTAPIFDVDSDFSHEVDPRLLDDIQEERND